MAEKEKLRIDKYLWAIRMFKTRTLASDTMRVISFNILSNKKINIEVVFA